MSADDEKAKQSVLTVLVDYAIDDVNFTFSGISVKSTMYKRVARAITDDKMTVIVSQAALPGGIDGGYVPELPLAGGAELYDVLILRSPDLGTTPSQQVITASLIVHECTHAGFDLLRVPNMKHADDEAGAYVAGLLFMLAKLANLGVDLSTIPTPPDKINEAALKLARSIFVEDPGHWRNPEYAIDRLNGINLLYAAIITDGRYKAAARVNMNHDGVGRPPKPPRSR